MDRITKIIYPDGTKDVNNKTDNPLYTIIRYNTALNERIVIDAEKNETKATKDWSGNVIQVAKKYKGNWLESTARYDQLGN